MQDLCVFLTFPVSNRYIGTDPKTRGDSHMKQTGMLVVSLGGVNFGFGLA